MRIGTVFPQNEIGADPGAVLAFAQATEELGFTHLLAYDHVLGADRTVHTDLTGPYGIEDTFHEPLILFAWLGAQTSLEFATAILVAPQRQTALIAKQAAEVDILTGGGRLRLGLGIGWNHVEYTALGVPFSGRGDRIEAQMTVLRKLWCEERVTSHDDWHELEAVGLAPLPPTRPIPLWLGAFAPAALRRVGRTADGWFPQVRPGAGLEDALELVASAARAAGRDPASIGMEGQILVEPGRMRRHADKWQSAGATHLAVNTLGAGSVDQHIAALRVAAEELLVDDGTNGADGVVRR